MDDAADSSWIVEFIEGSGHLGVALLMFAETVLPPIPSEVVMPTVGFLAADSRLSLPGGIASGAAGSLAGAYLWFLVARYVGAERLKRWAERHGRWLTMSPADVDRMCRWFHRRGHLAVLFGRLVPGVRSLVSVPAGVAAMNAATFVLWTAIGTGVWSGGLAGIGYALGERYDGIGSAVGYVSNGVTAGSLALYIYRVVTFQPTRR